MASSSLGPGVVPRVQLTDASPMAPVVVVGADTVPPRRPPSRRPECLEPRAEAISPPHRGRRGYLVNGECVLAVSRNPDESRWCVSHRSRTERHWGATQPSRARRHGVSAGECSERRLLDAAPHGVGRVMAAERLPPPMNTAKLTTTPAAGWRPPRSPERPAPVPASGRPCPPGFAGKRADRWEHLDHYGGRPALPLRGGGDGRRTDSGTRLTCPVGETVATTSALVDQMTGRPVSVFPAPSRAVATSHVAAPTSTVSVPGDTVTLATGSSPAASGNRAAPGHQQPTRLLPSANAYVPPLCRH